MPAREDPHYLAERLSRARTFLLERSDEFPLQKRLERARAEGFSAMLTDVFPKRYADEFREWEAIGAEFETVDSATVGLALMSDEDLEALEARVLEFIQRCLDVIDREWEERHPADA